MEADTYFYEIINRVGTNVSGQLFGNFTYHFVKSVIIIIIPDINYSF